MKIQKAARVVRIGRAADQEAGSNRLQVAIAGSDVHMNVRVGKDDPLMAVLATYDAEVWVTFSDAPDEASPGKFPTEPVKDF